MRTTNSARPALACFVGILSFGCGGPSKDSASTFSSSAGGTTSTAAAGSEGTTSTTAASTTTSGATTGAVATATTTGASTTSTSTDGGATVTSTTGAGTTTGAAGATSTSTSTTGGTPVACTFTVDYELSSAIGTVGIVTWSTDLAGLASAHIDFGLSDQGFTMSAPVDLANADYRTLLLGMKGERDYSFQIVASTAGETCTSDTFSLTTGAVSGAPTIQRSVENEAAIAPGFFIAATGGGGGGGGGGGSSTAFILDSDGDIVWWTAAPGGTGPVRMNWAGTDMYMMAVNNGGGSPAIRRVSMDGLDVEDMSGFGDSHHDFTPLPDGSIVFPAHLQNGCSAIVQLSPNGTVSDIIPDVSTLYQPQGECHPNAIHYYEADDSFTISDRNPNLFVKFTRSGQLQWQFGGGNPLGPHIPGSWQVNHGHHLLPDGTFLFFNNGQGGGGSVAREYLLDTSALTATDMGSYSSNNGSGTLGDVQRLPNGNTVVTYSNDGVIHEVDPNWNLVQSFSTNSLGYTQHRPTLYGPPAR